MSDETPEQTMQYAAIGLHELYESYIRAGFTEAQAFELVKTALVVGLGRKGK